MNASPNARRFSLPSIGLHWATLLLLAAVYALIELHGMYPKGSEMRETLKIWHFMLGLTVPCLVLARLLLRQFYPAPAIVPAPPAWQQGLAGAMHVTLYAFLVVMPLLGWLALSAKGRPVPLFGLELPALLPPDKALGKSLEKLHESIGVAGYWLIGLHAAAALFHHYFMRDNTLRLMLPWLGEPGKRRGTAAS